MNDFRFAILGLCFFIISFSGYAQIPDDINNAYNTLNERGEVYFRFQNKSTSDLKLNNAVTVDRNSNGNWIYAYANKKQFGDFLDLNIDFEVLAAPGLLHKPEMKGKVNIESIDEWDFYPTYESYVDIMYQFEANYPDLCKIVNIGITVEGRKLLFAKITDNVSTGEAEPRFMYTSTMHGDETGGYVLMLHLIDYLLTNYGSDNAITNLVTNSEIWINPLANPDGTFAMGNSSVWGATRYNGNNIDLNRNYPDPEDGPHPDGNEWQPETEAFMHLADSIQFTLSANLHAGTEVCNYPWDTWSKLHADDDWWQFVCREYADTAHIYSPSGYMTQYDNGITNGYAWYTISGGRQDYMNYFAGCREFTLEMSNTYILIENKLPLFWEYNYRSFLNYMKQVLYGFQGTVTNSETGEPVNAKVTLINHDLDNSFVFAGEDLGDFYRPVFAGTYDLKFSANGYHDKIIESKSISNYETIFLNVSMEKNTGIDENKLNSLFVLSPNPASGFLTITYSGKEQLNCSVSLISVSGEEVYCGDDKFSENTSLIIELAKFSSGVYFVRITNDGVSINKKIIKK